MCQDEVDITEGLWIGLIVTVIMSLSLFELAEDICQMVMA